MTCVGAIHSSGMMISPAAAADILTSRSLLDRRFDMKACVAKTIQILQRRMAWPILKAKVTTRAGRGMATMEVGEVNFFQIDPAFVQLFYSNVIERFSTRCQSRSNLSRQSNAGCEKRQSFGERVRSNKLEGFVLRGRFSLLPTQILPKKRDRTLRNRI